MKQVIKVKILNRALPAPSVYTDGEWIDLRASKDIKIEGPHAAQARKSRDRKVIFETAVIPLGVAIQLPKGYEAVVNSRSSIYKHYFCMLVNGQGVIDNKYCGDNDEWFAELMAFVDTEIKEGDRIVQFRIQLSQKATMWQRIKWLFSRGVKIKVVEHLGNPNRGGHGHSGKK